jgi:hypothetical protein
LTPRRFFQARLKNTQIAVLRQRREHQFIQ